MSKPGLRQIKAFLKKLEFSCGIKPKVNKGNIPHVKFIPNTYKAVCLISADFEMAWASRYTKGAKQPLEKAIKDGELTRRNLPVILDICDKYNIPVTWATVGHLFLEKCSIVDGIKHPDIHRLPYFENDFWKFDKGDWFDYDPCTNYQTSPAWYAPDLINDILSRKTKHEIGCHTFSHIDCRDSVCSDDSFNAEINKCIALAGESGVNLKSFVHPGHTIGHLNNLKEMGFTSYRTERDDSLGYPERHESGLWNFINTAQIDEEAGWSAEDSAKKFCQIIDKAIKTKTICNLWFHPQIKSVEFVNHVFGKLVKHLHDREKDIWVVTMSEYADFLNEEKL